MTRPELHHTYAEALPDLSTSHRADPVPSPRLIALSEDLAVGLGLEVDWLRTDEGVAWLCGQDPTTRTVAQAYAGHQFGSPNPQLGDGRAVLLGELLDPRGNRWDLHLKGSGRTPYARAGADGKAPLGPMLRELVVGEALHALGIPTTRILAVIGTGERIAPRRGITPEPGAIAVRVAASHLRVGTVQYAAWHHGPEVTARLVRYALERHHPQALADLLGERAASDPDGADQALALLREVTQAQARLVAQWMGAGFVHGVMNTDNMTLSGQSIDFGPCAFLDVHRQLAVFSSIDTGGRYAYGRQPAVALWNLERLAEALLPVIDRGDPQAAIDAATAVLEDFAPAYESAFARVMAAKLGVPFGEPTGERGQAAGEAAGRSREARPVGERTEPRGPRAEPVGEQAQAVTALTGELFALLEEHRVDHTGFFRALTEERAEELFPAGAAREAFTRWAQHRADLCGTGPAAEAAAAAMTQINPIYIARNAHLEQALRGAELGDLTAFEQILAAVRSPFARHAGCEYLETAGEGAEHIVTFCGT